MSRLRSPIANARGLGSAKDGTGHFWVQRLTAIALVPLLLWFVANVVGLTTGSVDAALLWLGAPFNAVLFIALMLSLCWHSVLGLQVIVEDYIHAAGVKFAVLIALKFTHALLAITAVVAILRISAGT